MCQYPEFFWFVILHIWTKRVMQFEYEKKRKSKNPRTDTFYAVLTSRWYCHLLVLHCRKEIFFLLPFYLLVIIRFDDLPKFSGVNCIQIILKLDCWLENKGKKILVGLLTCFYFSLIMLCSYRSRTLHPEIVFTICVLLKVMETVHKIQDSESTRYYKK